MIFTRHELMNLYNTEVRLDEIYADKIRFVDGISRTALMKEAMHFADNEPGVTYISGRDKLGRWFKLERDDKQYKPEWFTGSVGEESKTAVNRHTGDTIKLNPLEVALYDFILTSERFTHWYEEQQDSLLVTRNIEDKTRLAKGWFYENNAEAYLKLID